MQTKPYWKNNSCHAAQFVIQQAAWIIAVKSLPVKESVDPSIQNLLNVMQINAEIQKIVLSNRCKLPIVPTDLFPRELAQITGLPYPRIKISFDAICLTVTAGMTFLFLGHLKGIGIGTVLAALTMGKVIGIMGAWLDKHFVFDIYHRKTKV